MLQNIVRDTTNITADISKMVKYAISTLSLYICRFWQSTTLK